MDVQGVIFDLDGTLTRPHLDFARIRAEIGLPPGNDPPILESLARMSSAQRARADVILARHEHDAAQASELHPGAAETIETLRSRGVPVGILTRNSRVCTQIVIARHGLQIDCVHTREDGPVKPAPDAILAMCRRWNARPSRVWMVGDFLFDIQAGRAAGTRTVLMIGDATSATPAAAPPWATLADHVITRIPDLLPLLEDQAR